VHEPEVKKREIKKKRAPGREEEETETKKIIRYGFPFSLFQTNPFSSPFSPALPRPKKIPCLL